MTIFGTEDDDNFNGTSGPDDFDLSQGGKDSVHARGGADTIAFGRKFTAADFVDGGGGFDTIVLRGDYSSGIGIGAATVTNVEAFRLLKGFDYSLGFDDSVLATGEQMTIDASAIGAHTLELDTTGEQTGRFIVTAGAGDDHVNIGGSADDQLFGGAGNDVIATGSGADVVNGGRGDDFLVFFSLDTADRIDGGKGADTLDINGGLAGFAFTHDMMKNVEKVVLIGGTYTFDLTHLNAPTDVNFTIDGSDASAMNIDASDLRKYHGLVLIGGFDNDVLTGGRHSDTLFGRSGADTLQGGGAQDIFQYANGLDSTAAGFDTIIGFNALEDVFDAGTVDGVDAHVHSGRLRAADFDSDLGAAVDSDAMAAGHAVLFTPKKGDLAGQLFLIVDTNAEGGYQPGDLVIHLQGARNMADFDVTNFGP